MTDTSGPTSQTPFVFYDPDGSCWRTSQGTFPWASGTFSETWPKRGSMRSGACFEQPTWEPPTDAHACSSLLPTPAAQEPGGTAERYRERLAEHDGRESTFTPLGMLVQELLPTPTAWLGRREAHSQGDPRRWENPERSNELSDFVAWLLPTPTSRDHKGRNQRDDETCLPGAVGSLGDATSPPSDDGSD